MAAWTTHEPRAGCIPLHHNGHDAAAVVRGQLKLDGTDALGMKPVAVVILRPFLRLQPVELRYASLDRKAQGLEERTLAHAVNGKDRVHRTRLKRQLKRVGLVVDAPEAFDLEAPEEVAAH